MQIFSRGFLLTVKIVIEFVFVLGLLPRIILVAFRFAELTDWLLGISEPTLLLSNRTVWTRCSRDNAFFYC